MKRIVKDNNAVEFTDGLESFFIADIEGNLQRVERIKENIAAYDVKKNLKTIVENY